MIAAQQLHIIVQQDTNRMQLCTLSSIEAAWNMNKYAHEARKQRLVDVCVVALSEAGKLLKRVNAQNLDNINAELRRSRGS